MLVEIESQPTARGTLFIRAGAWIVFAADVNVLNDLAIAFISVVIEAEARALAVRLAEVLGLLEASHVVGLADRTDSVRNVVQFVDQCVTNGSPTNSGTAKHQSDHEHQLGRHHETGVVIEKFTQHVCETLFRN